MPIADKITFYNVPVRHTRKDYEGAVADAAKDLSRYDIVHSAYLMGSNWTPGISDIDMIVVYNDFNAGEKPVFPSKPASVSSRTSYPFTHDYNRYSKSLFKHLRYVMPTYYDLECVYGTSIKPFIPNDELTDEEYKNIQASYVVSVLLSKLLLIPLKFRDVVDVRRALLWLHSIHHTIRLVKEITGEALNSDFSDTVRQLRVDWFELDDDVRLKMLDEAIREAPHTIGEIVHAIDAYIRLQAPDVYFPKQPVFSSPVFLVKGIKDWNMHKFLTESRQKERRVPLLKKKFKRYRLVVPESFFIIFSQHRNMHGPYNKWVNTFLDLGGARVQFTSKGIQKRFDHLNDFIEDERGRLLTNTVLQFGFYTTDIRRELFKRRIFSLLRLT